MNHILLPLKIELVKLFRKSNILSLLVFGYLYFGMLYTISQETKATPSELDFYTNLQIILSPIGLLVMALFFVNSIGNDFVEGSYRKLIALGLSVKEYLVGKLMLILLFAALILLSNTALFYLFGMVKLNSSTPVLLGCITIPSIVNQTIALFTAGVFGFLFVAVSRNRVIGLVFFPLWLSFEFVFRLMEYRSDTKLLTTFSPGNALFNLYNTTNADAKPLLVVLITGIVFVTTIYLSLKYRDVKGPQLQ